MSSIALDDTNDTFARRLDQTLIAVGEDVLDDGHHVANHAERFGCELATAVGCSRHGSTLDVDVEEIQVLQDGRQTSFLDNRAGVVLRDLLECLQYLLGQIDEGDLHELGVEDRDGAIRDNAVCCIRHSFDEVGQASTSQKHLLAIVLLHVGCGSSGKRRFHVIIEIVVHWLNLGGSASTIVAFGLRTAEDVDELLDE